MSSQRIACCRRPVAATLMAIAVVTIGQVSQAATVTWGTPTAISPTGDTIVATTGALVTAINYTTAAAAKTANGVTFTGQTTAPSGWTANFFNASVYTDGNVGTEFGSLLDTFAYGPSGSTLTLAGLTPGQDYLVQFFVSDDRTTAPNPSIQTQTFTGGANTSASAAHGLSYSLIGAFTADGSASQTFMLTAGVDTNDVRLNGFQLRAVAATIPVPSALPAGIALLALAAMRRRRS